jgi:hypothetical protein
MTWLNGLIGVLLLAATIFGSVLVQRRISGDDTPLFGSRKRRHKEDDNEIAAFIAAYKSGQSGQSDPSDLLSGDTDVLQVVPAEIADGDGDPVATATPSAATSPTSTTNSGNTAAYLRPEVKLAYLTFRSGLRDHHIFVNALLRDLGYGTAVVGKVDLLVCDSSFNFVALVDVYTDEPVKDMAKSAFLSRTGVKHLSLSTKAMPKPGELRELIYGAQTG